MKISTIKAKGRETENLLVEYLESFGLEVERRRLTGAADQGDIAGWKNVCVEVKSGAKLDIPGWMRELEAEIINSKAKTGFLAIRPKGKPNPKDWFIVMSTDRFMELMKKAKYL